MMSSRIPSFIATAVVIGAITLSLAGFLAVPMGDMAHEGMSGCIFVQMDAICPMGFLEHLALLKQTFATALPESALFVLVLLVLALVAKSAFEIPERSPPPRRLRQRYPYETAVSDWRPLQEAFSNGILNRKVY